MSSVVKVGYPEYMCLGRHVNGEMVRSFCNILSSADKIQFISTVFGWRQKWSEITKLAKLPAWLPPEVRVQMCFFALINKLQSLYTDSAL